MTDIPVVTVVDDPGGVGFHIDGLWAYLAVGEQDGGEGVVAWNNMPLIAADRARLDSLRPYAEQVAKAAAKRVVLVRFDQRTDVEVLEP
jgi:hypothetical protein